MLDDIVASVRAKLPSIVARGEEYVLAARAVSAPRPFAAALVGSGLGVIAEVKRRSPSAGELAPHLDPATTARAFAAGGARAISVLTEPDHFGGSLDDLVAVRGAIGVPVLRKDFILDRSQIWQGRAAGADAVLLIAAILSDSELAGLIAEAGNAGIDAVVEVHSAVEATRALAAGARVVGVNNRDLSTFEVDLAVAERLAPHVAPAEVTVAESGIESAVDAARMAAAGYDAILVGQSAVTASDPVEFLGSLAAVPTREVE